MKQFVLYLQFYVPLLKSHPYVANLAVFLPNEKFKAMKNPKIFSFIGAFNVLLKWPNNITKSGHTAFTVSLLVRLSHCILVNVALNLDGLQIVNQRKYLNNQMQWKICTSTVKPVYNDHSWNQKKRSLSRWLKKIRFSFIF